MLSYRTDSIFESTAQTLVNPVNTMGVMGKGLALEFQTRFPTIMHGYLKACGEGTLVPGMLQLHKAPSRWILNFPTKTNWRKPSKLRWIDLGLQKFVESYEKAGVTSVAFPRLGCGNGGLLWEQVQPLMVNYLSSLPIEVTIHLI